MDEATSIDITLKGVNEDLARRISLEKMLFFGDAIFPGENGYPEKEVGSKTVRSRIGQVLLRICGGIHIMKCNEAIIPMNLVCCVSRSTKNTDDMIRESTCGFNGIYNYSTFFYDLRALHIQSLYLRVPFRDRHIGCYG